MSRDHNLLLFAVALCAGAINSVAGGGSFLTLPTLLFAGVTPVVANATSTLAMWPGSLASAVAYRRELTATPVKWLVLLCAVSLVGGFVGAVLLVRTSDTSFMRLLPWLMLVAAVTFTFGGRLRRTPASLAPACRPRQHDRLVAVLQFVLVDLRRLLRRRHGHHDAGDFALAGMIDIHEMNALKTLLGVAINGLALLTFVVNGAIAWGPGLVMIAGAIVGGYFGAGARAHESIPKWVRLLVIVIGWTMTIYFFHSVTIELQDCRIAGLQNH